MCGDAEFVITRPRYALWMGATPPQFCRVEQDDGSVALVTFELHADEVIVPSEHLQTVERPTSEQITAWCA